MYSIIIFLIITVNIVLHVEKNYKKEHVKDIQFQLRIFFTKEGS